MYSFSFLSIYSLTCCVCMFFSLFFFLYTCIWNKCEMVFTGHNSCKFTYIYLFDGLFTFDWNEISLNDLRPAYCLRPGSIFCDIIVRILWFSITRRQLMYERTSPSLFGDGGSSTVIEMTRHKWMFDATKNEIELTFAFDANEMEIT